MKIDTNTVNVLKNFSKINPSIVVQQGNVLKTISPNKTIMAKATVPTEFTKKFAIYDLNQFLSSLSLYNDPDLEIDENFVYMKDSSSEQGKFLLADESTITKAPEKDINIPSTDVTFTLKNEDLNKVEKAAGVLSLPEIVVAGDGKNVYLKAANSKNPGNEFSIPIGETTKTFNAVFKFENIKILPGDYEVTISARGISKFIGKDVEYFIAVEQHSTF